MPTKKRLLIQIGSIENQNKIVPVNTGRFVDVSTRIGTFSVSVYIKNFDGSHNHRSNSSYNAFEERYLNGDSMQNGSTPCFKDSSNLRILMYFKPAHNINGSNLYFGNECSVPVRDRVPTTLMSTGLRLFKWFLNPTIECDLYGDRPFIYGLALNSFTKLGVADCPSSEFIGNDHENLNWDGKPELCTLPAARRKYFCEVENSKKFAFQKDENYFLMFETNFLKLADSNYNISIPALGKSTFDVNVLRFADEKLNSVNWTIKESTSSDFSKGEYGAVLNFKIIEEEVMG